MVWLIIGFYLRVLYIMTAQHAKVMIEYKIKVLSEIEQNQELCTKIKNAKFVENKTNKAIAEEFFVVDQYKWELDTLAQVIADFFAWLSKEENAQYKEAVKRLSSRKNTLQQSESAKKSVEGRWQTLYSDQEKIIILNARIGVEWIVPLGWRENLANELNKLPFNKKNNIIRVAINIRTWYNKQNK